MKKLVVVIVVALVGLVAFNYAKTGEFRLSPSFEKSVEEQAVQDLQDSFTAAKRQFAQAHRSAGLSGIDTSSDVSAAISSVKSTKRELEKLRRTLSEDKAKRRAGELADAVKDFERTL